MASQKLSALTAVTSVGNDDLLYIADTSDGGSTFASKKVTKSNFLSGYATTAYADANETHIDNLATLSGIAKDGTNLGTFTGTTISDNVTIKAALQALETAVEAAEESTVITEIDGNVNDLITLSGVAENATDLGTFTGSTISDNETVKQALQDLETAVESAQAGSGTADGVKTVTDATNASRFLTFVADDNVSATSETVFTDAGITYNPSTNTLNVGNLSVAGTTTTVDTVTMEAANAIVFEGATADANESTLTIIDPTADRTIKLPDQSGCLPVLAADSSTAITATPEELNVLDGITSTVAELNILDGVTATAAEINLLDGVTATTAELNILDGVTATAAELNILDGVTATTAELNLLDGVTATTAELNYVDGVTSNIQTQLDAKTADGDNVNVLVGNTTADTVPTTYYFLVVDQSDGSIKAIDKTFLETEG
jgi:hypothetical protein